MVLEATMIIVDNSESSRNGDYHSSRFDAQVDAVRLIFHAKTQSNPESSVGLMSMGGHGPEVLVTLTTDFGKVLDGLHRTKISGKTHLSTSIQVAGLALKHRQNKTQRQRIIIFACSPIEEDEKSLVKLAKKMKKNNVSIDFVVFGEFEGDNTKKLEAFNENVKGGDGSHMAIVPPGPHLLSDVLVTTPILGGSDRIGGAANSGGANLDNGNDVMGSGFDFGIDPAQDPELALALKMSLEEDKKARRERAEKEKEESDAKAKLTGITEEEQPLIKDNAESKNNGNEDDHDKMDTA
ncbi:MAG: hypothetical protein M1829_002428 [Trizodia sp. TS-e1964]|nr:MAG: hypothetical protein M1829_002428 [Trizodia sp. TS-e1964]